MINTPGNEDSRSCSLATSHRSSLPHNLIMSLIFLPWQKYFSKQKCGHENLVSMMLMFRHSEFTVQDLQQMGIFQPLDKVESHQLTRYQPCSLDTEIWIKPAWTQHILKHSVLKPDQHSFFIPFKFLELSWALAFVLWEVDIKILNKDAYD